jgi:hypothetical protein
VGPILVVVADIFREEPLQMPLVENNHVIEQVPAAALNPAFRDAILPRALE